MIHPMAATIEPIKKIWKRDRNRYKPKAQSELGYVYYMCGLSRLYEREHPEDRERIIKRDVGLDDNYEPDELVREAIHVVKAMHQTSSAAALESASGVLRTSQDAIEVMRSKLQERMASENVNPKAIAEDIKLLLDISGKIGPAIEAVEKIADQLDAELADTGKMRGGYQKGPYEDPD